uniref:Uncharacterized protein n=1 Tax=Rhizophora mucronata TaxID=61149 RepID=A0A2P2MZV1_RHIMU
MTWAHISGMVSYAQCEITMERSMRYQIAACLLQNEHTGTNE